MEGKRDARETAPHDKDPLTAVRHALIELGLIADDNMSAQLDFGMLRV
jgi:hypothetical protein